MNAMKTMVRLLWFVVITCFLAGLVVIMLGAHNSTSTRHGASPTQAANDIPDHRVSVTAPRQEVGNYEAGYEFIFIVETPTRAHQKRLKKRLNNMQLAQKAAWGREDAKQLVQHELRVLEEQLNELGDRISLFDVEFGDGVDELYRELDRVSKYLDIKMQLYDLSGNTIDKRTILLNEMDNAEKMEDSYDKKAVEQFIKSRVGAIGFEKCIVKFSEDNNLSVKIIEALENDKSSIIKTLQQHVNKRIHVMHGNLSRVGFAPSYNSDTYQNMLGDIVSLDRRPVFTYSHIKDIRQIEGKNWPNIEVEFNDEGAKILSEFTMNNAGKYLALVVDDLMLCYQRINYPHNDVLFRFSSNTGKQQSDLTVRYYQLPHLPVKLRVIEAKKSQIQY